MSSIRQAERGAVHIMYVIGVLIVALVFGVLWFSQLSKNEDLEKRAAQATAALVPAQKELQFAKKSYTEAAKVLGGGFPAELTIPEGVAQGVDIMPADDNVFGNIVKQYMTTVREAARAAGDPSAAPKTALEAVNAVKARYDVQTNEVTVRDTQIAGLRAESAAKDTQIAAANKRRDDDVAAVNTEKDNVVARLTQQGNDASAERDALQAQVRTLNDAMTKLKTDTNTEVNAASLKTKELDATVGAMKSEARLERETIKSDGKILAVNRGGRTAWIDAGGKDQLRRGAIFRVYETVKGGVKTYKGKVVVTSVERDRAEVRIASEEPGMAITEGDWIYNPTFDRARSMHFVFLGELNGSVSKEVATRVLEANGAKVDDKISTSTDFLVLGAKETPESEELTESPVYKEALRWGIEIIRASDLEVFLKP
jgi:hypothetical protein